MQRLILSLATGEETMSEKDSNVLKQEIICFKNSLRWMLLYIDGKSKLESLDYNHRNLNETYLMGVYFAQSSRTVFCSPNIYFCFDFFK